MWLVLARHGQTDDNLQGIIQGHKDTPLNDWGRFESARLAGALRTVAITEAYTSPLSRASETASIALRHRPEITIHEHPGLKERGLGSWEGRRPPRKEPTPADAEGYESLTLRSKLWFDELLSNHIPPPPPATESKHRSSVQDADIIFVVSHGAWLSNFRHLLLSPAYHFKIDRHCNLKARCINTSISLVYCEYDHAKKKWTGVLQMWANVEHLRDVLEKEKKVGIADDVGR
ncbi:hypothetical protein L202_06381 [Cryptococcus amylolentus CBS 6039]|uniref:Phosphoglycerate mutase n=1 Tax=Cryptococcus amylolentus CBS 6039 TaxID=1295533 RepID=A0A1E3HFR5_9TREE|nr:hypothetical protein L202_06381 [Cryptococcus amylolentus CBS 6039]ODN75182.1 hypothetical protein L202_06381 [Cryptococcus amylolentus CBS 6039]